MLTVSFSKDYCTDTWRAGGDKPHLPKLIRNKSWLLSLLHHSVEAVLHDQAATMPYLLRSQKAADDAKPIAVIIPIRKQ